MHSEQESVTLALEGAPPGLWHRFSSTSGIPSFSTTLFMADSGILPGDYVLTIAATGERSGRQAIPFKLHVLAPEDCSSVATGNNLKAYNYCFSNEPYAVDIRAVPGQPSKILFSNFDGKGSEVYGFVRCDWERVVIPEQTVNGIHFEESNYGQFMQFGDKRVLEILYKSNEQLCSLQIELK